MAVKFVSFTLLVIAVAISGICAEDLLTVGNCLAYGCPTSPYACLTDLARSYCIPLCFLPGCPETQHCPAGVALDARGCSSCTCNPDPCQDCPNKCAVVNGQLACSTTCPELACPGLVCPYGRKPGPDGCLTCECLRPPCCCSMGIECPGIQQCVIKPETCTGYPCFPKPKCVCPLWDCGTPNCKKQRTCEFGYGMDRKGCPTCNCARDPCKRYRCPGGKRCVPTPPPSDCSCCGYSAQCV